MIQLFPRGKANFPGYSSKIPIPSTFHEQILLKLFCFFVRWKTIFPSCSYRMLKKGYQDFESFRYKLILFIYIGLFSNFLSFFTLMEPRLDIVNCSQKDSFYSLHRYLLYSNSRAYNEYTPYFAFVEMSSEQ